MGGLHRGNDAKFRKSRYIIDAHHLRMLDAMAKLTPLGILLQAARIDVQSDTIGPVAYRVHIGLESLAADLIDQRLQGVLILDHQSAGIGSITVGRQQRRASAAEGAICIDLDAANIQPVFGVVVDALRENLVKLWVA